MSNFDYVRPNHDRIRTVKIDVDKLQAARWDAGLSQRELARRAGVSQTTVWLLERGGGVRPATLKRIADVLGVRPTELLREDSL